MSRSPLIPKSRKGKVNPLDLYLTGELSGKWGVSHDHVCQAARELGSKATIEAVHRRAVELREAAAKRRQRG